jgi:DNA-binding NarL/FixJ family response regulator
MQEQQEQTQPKTRTGPARLLIADDHELSRTGLRGMLASEEGLEVVGEATNGREAVVFCRRLRPNLVLMDLRMPELDGLAATRAIKQESPGTSVIIVTMHENPEYLFEALKAGAAGYLLKDATREEVLSAVWRVLGGEALLDAELATRLLQRLAHEAQRAKPPGVPLTPRESEVLQLLTQGRTNRQIAEELVITPGTAKLYVERILGKLGVSDRTQAAVRAVELGLVTPSSD